MVHVTLNKSGYLSLRTRSKLVRKVQIIWTKGLDNLADLDVSPTGISSWDTKGGLHTKRLSDL